MHQTVQSHEFMMIIFFESLVTFGACERTRSLFGKILIVNRGNGLSIYPAFLYELSLFTKKLMRLLIVEIVHLIKEELYSHHLKFNP